MAKILLVDDDKMVRDGMSLWLRDLDYEVVEAGSALDAMNLLIEDNAFDLIISDFEMPGTNGIVFGMAAATKVSIPFMLLTGSHLGNIMRMVESNGLVCTVASKGGSLAELAKTIDGMLYP